MFHFERGKFISQALFFARSSSRAFRTVCCGEGGQSLSTDSLARTLPSAATAAGRAGVGIAAEGRAIRSRGRRRRGRRGQRRGTPRPQEGPGESRPERRAQPGGEGARPRPHCSGRFSPATTRAHGPAAAGGRSSCTAPAPPPPLPPAGNSSTVTPGTGPPGPPPYGTRPAGRPLPAPGRPRGTAPRPMGSGGKGEAPPRPRR